MNRGGQRVLPNLRETTMLETVAENQNSRVEVLEETRLEMLPKYFGEKHMLRVEASIWPRPKFPN